MAYHLYLPTAFRKCATTRRTSFQQQSYANIKISGYRCLNELLTWKIIQQKLDSNDDQKLLFLNATNDVQNVSTLPDTIFILLVVFK